MKHLKLAIVAGLIVTLSLCFIDALKWDKEAKACRAKGGTVLRRDGCFKITSEKVS